MKTITERKLDIGKLNIGYGEAKQIWMFLYDDKQHTPECKFNSALDVIGCIRAGLPKEGIDAFLEKTNVSRNQLSHILHISTRQLNRYEPHERLAPEQSNFLYELTRIYTKATDALGNQSIAEHWLSRKHIALGDKSPLEILDTTEGSRLVDDLLAQIEHGYYS